MAERIVSPGVFTNEVDQSFLAGGVAQIGAAIVGPTVKGPALIPTQITSFSDFVATFGSYTDDSYVPYVVQDYLRNGNVITVTRLLYEDGYNFVTMTLTYNSVDIDIDWGDGVIDNITGTASTVISHTYDYITLGGTIKIDPLTGRNYKQVIIDLVVNSGTFTGLQLVPVTSINNSGNVQFVDISMSLPNASSILLSSPNKRLMHLERLAIYNNNITAPASFSLTDNVQRLGEFIYEPISLTSLASELQSVGCINGFDIIANSATSFAATFANNNYIRKVNNISSTSVTTALQMFSATKNIWYCGNITLPICTTLQNMFSTADNLIYVGLIDTPLVQNLSATFNGCRSLQSVEFTDLSLCTITVSAFTGCTSLEFAILPNLTVGFSVASTAMGAQALNDMFTSLGTAAGVQTIIVSNTPGAATCDTTIATSKGFIVTI
jgi:hypothetical protein